MLLKIPEALIVEAAGFEPATSGVRFQRSPSELRPHLFSASNFSATKSHTPEVKCFVSMLEHCSSFNDES